MEESFELLSSMSPKLKGRQKTVKKAIRILALKKHVRRSSIYDRGPAARNEDLAIVEMSSESSETSSNFQQNICKNDNSNKKNVIIIDSTDSDSCEDLHVPKTKKVSLESLRKCDKKPTTNRIQEWLDNIDTNENKNNSTLFSQVSTIYGDEAPKFNPDGNGLAACSTLNEYMFRRFDELFILDKTGLEKKTGDVCISDDSFSNEINISLRTKLPEKPHDKANSSVADKNNRSFNSSKDLLDCRKDTNDIKGMENIVIDETLLTSDESIVEPSSNYKSPVLSPKLDSERTPKRTLPNLGDNITTRKKNANILQELKNNPCESSLGMERMLDSLYGAKWREKQNHVVPLSEPRKKVATKDDMKMLAPNTESRILKPSKKDNKLYKENPATKKLNFVRLNTPIVSPWVERLKGLIDSDSDSNSENTNEKNTGIDKVKTRLNFLEDSPLMKPLNVENAKKHCDDKAKVDNSYYNESLEDRIRKKMNNTKAPAKTNRNNSKKGVRSNNNKENENKTKEKPKGLQNENEKLSTLQNDSKKNSTKKTNKKTFNNKTKKTLQSYSSSDSCSEIEISSDEEYDKEVTRMCEIKRKSIMPLKEGTYSFLESLSASIPLDKCDMAARIFRTGYKHYRSELAKKLFSLYNEKVFGNSIPADTELEWNDKLRNTAGLCYCRKITHRSGNVVRKVRISLSSKVLDSSDRLRDTLIHEMCHAATWIINQIPNGHGIYWKNWAFKAMKAFPELPPIKRCHSYEINTKYTYKCTGCGYSIGRHSKSLDTERKRCGHCYGKFELLINKTLKSGVTRTVPVTPRKQATAFSVFVKENYARYKEPSKKHGDVMKILGQKFSELKVKNSV